MVKSSTLFRNLFAHLNAEGYTFIVNEFYTRHKNTDTLLAHIHGDEYASNELLDLLTELVSETLSEERSSAVLDHIYNTRLLLECNAIMDDDVDPLVTEQRLEAWIDGGGYDDHQARHEMWYNEI